MAYDAVLRNLAVIGEAVRSLPGETKERTAAHAEAATGDSFDFFDLSYR